MQAFERPIVRTLHFFDKRSLAYFPRLLFFQILSLYFCLYGMYFFKNRTHFKSFENGVALSAQPLNLAAVELLFPLGA